MSDDQKYLSIQASIEHFLVKHHEMIEELTLMHAAINEYLEEFQKAASRNNVVPLHKPPGTWETIYGNDDPEDCA